MYVYTENYGDVVRWKYYPENDIEEIENDHETYTFIDELLQDVRKNIKDIYDGSFYKSFYAVLLDDVIGKVLRVHEFAITTKIYVIKDDDLKDISEGWYKVNEQ